MEDLTGKQLGPYQIVAPLGEGGMAAVYKAYQPGMDRYVALKILPRKLAEDPQFVGRFKHEAKVLAKLQHPHILPVFDFGEADGYTYIVMPFVESGTLADLLRGQPLPIKQIRSIISQIGGALNYAHSHGLVHRDVKPSNVLIDETGNCLLTDFGIAKLVEGTAKFTSTGAVIGTPAYMSPEQGRGEKLDGRSDIYSLGIILYEMATGRVPFHAETPVAIIFKHISDPLPMPRATNPALPESVERVILKALAKNPEERFLTAAEMVAALEGIAETKTSDRTAPMAIGSAPTLTRPVKETEKGKAPVGERKRVSPIVVGIGVVAVACFLLVTVIGGGVYMSSLAGKPATATSAPNAVATQAAAAPAASQTAEAAIPPATDSLQPPETPAPIAPSGTIKVVSDLPMTGSSLGLTQTIVNAITMAFEERQYMVCNGLWSIDYEPHDDASTASGNWDPDVVVANARAYVSDPDIVAVIGTFNSGAAKLMIPILNPENLVMISPGNTYPGLTKPGQWAEGEPDMYYPNGIRNYTRVVPADDVQGAAGAHWAKELGVNSVYVLDDGELYGASIARVFAGKAQELGIELVGYETIPQSNFTNLATVIVGKNPDMVYFSGITQNNAGQLFRDVRAAGYAGRLMGPDGIYNQAFLDEAGSAAEGAYLTSPGVPPWELTGAAADWRNAYSRKFTAPPSVFTVYGYVAATMLMDAFDRVCAGGGSPADRAAVRDAVLATESFNSVLGAFSIDEHGDTTLNLMSGSQVRNGEFIFLTLLGGN